MIPLNDSVLPNFDTIPAGVPYLYNPVAQDTINLPDYKQLKEYSPSIISRLYTGEGSLLAEFSAEKRIFIPINSMPENVINAFVSAEDKNFFKHKGLDFKSILLIESKELFSPISVLYYEYYAI
mgnify:CR=1 FL=1